MADNTAGGDTKATAPSTPTAQNVTTPVPPTPQTPESPQKFARSSQSRVVTPRRFSAVFTAPVAKPVMRYAPTYRLESKHPLNRETCEKIIKEVVDRALENFTYSSKQSLNLCAQLSEEIKNRVKAQNYDRYRYICVVTIGEKVMQGYCSLVNFLWDAERDSYINYLYDTPQFFAVVTLYYLYYD